MNRRGLVDAWGRAGRLRRLWLGSRGEDHAARWLRRRGYRVVLRNFSVGRDEVDLVVEAPDRRTVVLVEVKSATAGHTAPERAIDRKKQYQMVRLASKLRVNRAFRDRPMRFDAIAVDWRHPRPQIRHYPSAFDSPF